MQKFVDNEYRLAQKGEEEWKKEQIEAVAKRVTMWVKRWKDGIPFSALAVYRGKDFIGHVVAGYGENPGETEIAYIIRAEDWSKGYGSQAVEAVVQKWIPYLQQLGCLVEADNGEKHVVSTVVATSRKDNGPSNRILQKNGFHQIGQKEAYGLIRCVHQKKL